MTHNEIAERCNHATQALTGFERKEFRLTYRNLDDYISIAAANGCDPEQIFKLILENSKIGEKAALISINSFFSGVRGRPVEIAGTVYESVVTAAKELGKAAESVRYMIATGRAQYVKLAL